MIEKAPISIAFFISLFVSGIASPLVMRMLLKTNTRQKISEHVGEHAHKQGTPTMGGMIILIGLLIGGWVSQGVAAKIPLLLVFAYGLIGFIDDFLVPRMMQGKRGLGWKQKLVMQIVLTALIARLGTDNWVVIGWVVFWVLFMSNAYNFADGLDGLAGSLAVIIALTLLIYSQLSGIKSFTPAIMAALIGGLVPFLWWNAPPAKVFMGDVGALPIGALFGYTMVEIPVRATSLHWSLFIIPLALVSVIMFAELFPVPIQIAAVKILKRRVFTKTPIHHAFQAAGVPETRVVAHFVLIQFVGATLGVLWLFMMVKGLP